MLADKRIGTTINGLKKSQHKNLFFNLKQFNALLELCYDFVELYCNLPKRSKSSNLLPLQLLYIYIYIFILVLMSHTLSMSLAPSFAGFIAQPSSSFIL